MENVIVWFMITTSLRLRDLHRHGYNKNHSDFHKNIRLRLSNVIQCAEVTLIQQQPIYQTATV